MNNFITDLFNIDKDFIKSIQVVSSLDLTELHVSLIHQKQFCPFFQGITHFHGYSSPKVINHPKLTDKKCVIVYKNIRYQCNECLRTFSGKNPFSFSNFQNSYLALNNVMKSLSNLNYTYKMLQNWKMEILNSLIRNNGRGISNGPIETKNRLISILLFNANGYTNFKRSKNRIMYCLNNKIISN